MLLSKNLLVKSFIGLNWDYNALLDYPLELRERILVVAIAPAAYIYEEACAKVMHYRAEWWRDFVPRLDRTDARRARKSIVTLTSHADAGLFDHEFMSPTYEEKLQRHFSFGFLKRLARLYSSKDAGALFFAVKLINKRFFSYLLLKNQRVAFILTREVCHCLEKDSGDLV